MKKVVPRTPSLSAHTFPPWSKTMRCTMARPRPVPPFLVVKYGSKMLSMSVSGDADPGVAHRDAAESLLGLLHHVGPHGQQAAVRHGLDRVGEQVGEHALHLVPVGRHHEGSGHLGEVDANRGRRGSSRPRRPPRGASAGETRQGRGMGSLAKSPNSRSISSRLSTSVMIEATAGGSTLSKSGAFSPCFFSMPLGGKLDRREGIPDLVRQALRDLLPRGDPFRLQELAAGALQLGDHAVEGVHQRGKLVPRPGEDAEAEVSLGDAPRGVLQVGDGADDPLREQEAHEDGDEEDGQGEEEEEAYQHEAEQVAELVQRRENGQALGDPPHIGEQVSGQERARHCSEPLAVDEEHLRVPEDRHVPSCPPAGCRSRRAPSARRAREVAGECELPAVGPEQLQGADALVHRLHSRPRALGRRGRTGRGGSGQGDRP